VPIEGTLALMPAGRNILIVRTQLLIASQPAVPLATEVIYCEAQSPLSTVSKSFSRKG
jgi:hypothetical protein